MIVCNRIYEKNSKKLKKEWRFRNIAHSCHIYRMIVSEQTGEAGPGGQVPLLLHAVLG